MGSVIPAPNVAFNWPVSASQIDTFRDCERKWGWRYLDGIKTDPHPSAVLGTEVHGIAEQYQLKGTYPDRLTKAGDLFISGLPFMGPPGTGQVEGEFDMIIDGVRYRGFIDFRGKGIPGFDPERRVVRDYKTSKDPKKYGLFLTNKDYAHLGSTKAIFLNNPQAVLYGTYDVIQADDVDSALSWLYMRTEGRAKAEPVNQIVTRGELEEVFEPVVHNNGKRIVHLKMNPVPTLELEPNPEACNKYGGCPYKDRCNLTTRQKIAGALASVKTYEKQQGAKKNMGILDKIKADKAAGGSAPSSNGKTLHGGERDVVNPEEGKTPTPAKAERPAARASEEQDVQAETMKQAAAKEKWADRKSDPKNSREVAAGEVTDAQLGAALRLLRDFMLGRIG